MKQSTSSTRKSAPFVFSDSFARPRHLVGFFSRRNGFSVERTLSLPRRDSPRRFWLRLCCAVGQVGNLRTDCGVPWAGSSPAVCPRVSKPGFRLRNIPIPVTSFQNNLQTIDKLAAYWQIRRPRQGRSWVSGCYTCSQGREVVVDLSPACRVRRRLLGGLGARDSFIHETFTCEPPPIDGHLPSPAANGISGCGTCTFPGLRPEPAATGLPRR